MTRQHSIVELADGDGHSSFCSHVEIEARAGLPRSCCGPEPAAVRFKAAFRAAGGRIDPGSAWQVRVPREG